MKNSGKRARTDRLHPPVGPASAFDDELFAEVGDSVAGWRSFLLGAGFSKAVSNQMPVMKDLVTSVAGALNIPDDGLSRFGGDLERWLSFLGQDQPWNSDSENLRNRAAFDEAARSVFASISAAEQWAISAPAPLWFRRLVWTWKLQSSSVFTFNYDTLVERQLMSLGGLHSLADVYPMALSERIGVDFGRMFSAAPPTGTHPELFKLHGSINWGFGGLSAPPSEPIVMIGGRRLWVTDSTLVESQPPGSPRDIHRYDDLRPMIIPPSLTKGPYFVNHALRALWQQAAAAAAAAQELVVIGYSFPESDNATREWLATSLHPGATIWVVNRDESAVERARRLLPSHNIKSVIDDRAIEHFVDRHCGDHVEWWIHDRADGPAQIELSVNGGVRRSALAPEHEQWGQGADASKAWVHGLLESAEPGVVDRALQVEDSGKRAAEHKEVVLSPRVRLNVPARFSTDP